MTCSYSTSDFNGCVFTKIPVILPHTDMHTCMSVWYMLIVRALHPNSQVLPAPFGQSNLVELLRQIASCTNEGQDVWKWKQSTHWPLHRTGGRGRGCHEWQDTVCSQSEDVLTLVNALQAVNKSMQINIWRWLWLQVLAKAKEKIWYFIADSDTIMCLCDCVNASYSCGL